MHVHTVGCVFGPYDRTAFEVCREPWWTYAIVKAVDIGCVLTGHRWCNSAVVHWALRLSDKHTDKFTIPADEKLLVAYRRWRGFDWNGIGDDVED